MNPTLPTLAALLMLLPLAGRAAEQTFPVRERRVIVDDGGTRVERRREAVPFVVELLDDDDEPLDETIKSGRPFVAAAPGERYSIRIRNPLPVRVAVNLTVDGLNSISGKPSGISDGAKWMIEPYGSIVIRGWQVNGDQARRFFFADKPKSYAQWREKQTGLPLAQNCGVIGAAYFWDQAELDRYYMDNPEYRYSDRPWAVPVNPSPYGGLRRADDAAAAPAVAQVRGGGREDAGAQRAQEATNQEERQRAGTGMGETEDHPTTEVSFAYNTGMYRLDQAVLIYYDFAPRPPAPNPFPGLSYAPEMPRSL